MTRQRRRFSAEEKVAILRRLRNDIPIRHLIADTLDIPWKISDGRFRFLCPHCGEFNTATHPETNLACCFRCQCNFSPIDLTLIDNRHNFLQAVAFLHPYLPDAKRLTSTPQPTNAQPRATQSETRALKRPRDLALALWQHDSRNWDVVKECGN